MALDIRTVIISYLITNSISTLVIFQLYIQSRKRIKGVLYWLLDIFFQSIALWLIASRNQLSDFFSIVVANTLIIVGIYLGLVGLERFLNRKSYYFQNLFIIFIYIVSFTYFSIVQPDLALRNLIFSFGSLFIFFQSAWILLINENNQNRKLTLSVGVIFICFCIVNIIRILEYFITPHFSQNFFHNGNFESWILMVYQALTVILMFNITLLFNKRLLFDIELEENKFTKAFYSSPYAIILSKVPSGEIIDVNKGFVNFCGYNRMEVIGKKIADLRFWADDQVKDQITEEINLSGKIYNKELNYRNKNGENKSGLLSAEVINIQNERFIFSSINDITNLVNINKALIESEKQLRSFFENSMDAILLTGADGRIFSVNPAACEILGYTEEEIIAEGREGLVDTSDIRISKLLKERMEKGKAKGEIRLKRKNGEIFPAEISSAIFSTSKGERRASIVFRDISDRKKSEEIIKHRDLLIREMGKVAKIGGWEFDPKTGKGTWTEEVALIHDLRPDEETNMEKGIHFYTEDSRNKIEKAINLAIEEGKSYDLELELISAKGKHKWIHTIGNPMIEDGKVIKVRGSFQDITERKMVEDEIIKLNNELEQRVHIRTAQLESVNKELEAFTYTVSHDLRAPLRAIYGFTKILTEDYEQLFDDEGKRICKVIIENTQRMSNLIDDLLTFSRLSRTEINYLPVHMNSIAESVFNDILPENRKQKTTFILHNLPDIIGDAALIKQVWTNLLSNAIKFTSNNQEAVIEVGHDKDNKEYTFFVKDNGVGFNMAYVDKLFNVFQRLHGIKDFDGTGVGLAIVKRIISRHGGKVSAFGEVNKGASFYFTLPINSENVLLK